MAVVVGASSAVMVSVSSVGTCDESKTERQYSWEWPEDLKAERTPVSPPEKMADQSRGGGPTLRRGHSDGKTGNRYQLSGYNSVPPSAL